MKSWVATAAAAVAAVLVAGAGDASVWVWRALLAARLVSEPQDTTAFVGNAAISPMLDRPREAFYVGVVTLAAAAAVAAFATRPLTRNWR